MKRWIIAMATGLACSATQVWAQVPEAPPELSPDKSMVPYVIGVVLFVGACVGAFKPSKRSHLD